MGASSLPLAGRAGGRAASPRPASAPSAPGPRRRRSAGSPGRHSRAPPPSGRAACWRSSAGRPAGCSPRTWSPRPGPRRCPGLDVGEQIDPGDRERAAVEIDDALAETRELGRSGLQRRRRRLDLGHRGSGRRGPRDRRQGRLPPRCGRGVVTGDVTTSPAPRGIDGGGHRRRPRRPRRRRRADVAAGAAGYRRPAGRHPDRRGRISGGAGARGDRRVWPWRPRLRLDHDRTATGRTDPPPPRAPSAASASPPGGASSEPWIQPSRPPLSAISTRTQSPSRCSSVTC